MSRILLIAALVLTLPVFGGAVAVYPSGATSTLSGEGLAMFFTEQTVRVTFNRFDGPQASDQPFWVLRSQDDETVGVEAFPEAVWPEYGAEETMVVDFGMLPAGDYDLAWEWNGRNGVLELLVRSGSESPDVRRQFLRWKVMQSPSFAVAESLLIELGELEPENPWVWEQLGQRSLDVLPLEKTVEFFEKAAELARTNLAAAARGRVLSPETKADAELRVESLLTIPRISEYYRRHRETLKIGTRQLGGRTDYVWIDRSSGRVVGIIDPAAPDMRRSSDSLMQVLE
jgi:hypothetical protein